MYGNFYDLGLTTLLASNGDGGVSALGEDDCPWPVGILLGQAGNLLCNLLDVLGLETVGLSECCGFGLIADQDVDVWDDLIERILEEL